MLSVERCCGGVRWWCVEERGGDFSRWAGRDGVRRKRSGVASDERVSGDDEDWDRDGRERDDVRRVSRGRGFDAHVSRCG